MRRIKLNKKIIYILSIINILNFSNGNEIDKLLGVPDEKLELYKPQEGNVFKCLDGSKTIPYSSLNDDYCDCPDGSDEPGTSACPNTKFYCRNKGHIPAFIPSSRVNDGICDPECCDGSDENSGIVKCPNICEQIAYEQNKEELEKKKILNEGLEKKKKLILEAADIVKKENEKKGKLELEVENLDTKLNRLKEIQLIAEGVDQRVKELKEVEVNKIIIEDCPRVLKRCNDGYSDINSKFTINSKKIEIYEDGLNNILNLVNKIHDILTVENNENKVAEALESIKSIQNEIQSINNDIDSAEIEENKDVDENIEIIDSSDDEIEEDKNNNENDPFPLDLSVDLDNLRKALELTACEDTSKNVIFCVGTGLKSLFIGMKDNLVNDTKNLAGWKGWPRLKNPCNLTVKKVINKFKNLKKSNVSNEKNNTNVNRDAEFGINFEELKNNYLGVKSLIKSTQNDYDKKEKELNKIKEKTDIDFGPENVFRTLYNKCYDVEASGYIYTLCLFNEAKQKPKDGNSSTRLGTWDKFDSPEIMKFSNGEKCWNGPQRSAKVILKCSNKNELISVSEPSKCEYEMIFNTPAACIKTNETNETNETNDNNKNNETNDNNKNNETNENNETVDDNNEKPKDEL